MEDTPDLGEVMAGVEEDRAKQGLEEVAQHLGHLHQLHLHAGVSDQRGYVVFTSGGSTSLIRSRVALVPLLLAFLSAAKTLTLWMIMIITVVSFSLHHLVPELRCPVEEEGIEAGVDHEPGQQVVVHQSRAGVRHLTGVRPLLHSQVIIMMLCVLKS